MKMFKLFASLIVVLIIASADSEADRVKVFIEKATKLARVINGIALEAGIVENKIPIDKVIAELLRVEGNGIDELQNFNKDTMSKFIEALAKVETDLKDDPTELEKELIALGKMAKIAERIPSSINLPTNFTSLDKLKNFDSSHFVNLDIAQVDSDLQTAIKTSKGDLTISQRQLLSFYTAVNTLLKTQGLKDLLDNLDPYVAVIELLDELAVTPLSSITNQPDTNNLTANIGLHKEASDNSQDLGSIHSFLSSRFGYSLVDRIFTAGFVNGYEDIGKLSNDSKDEWLTTLFGEYINQKALGKLKTFKNIAKGIDKNWNTLTPDTRDKVELLMDWIGADSIRSKDALDVADVFPKIVQLAPPAINKPSYASAHLLMESIRGIRAQYTFALEFNKMLEEANLKKFEAMDQVENTHQLRRVLAFLNRITPLVNGLKQVNEKEKLSVSATSLLANQNEITGLASESFYTASTGFIDKVRNSQAQLRTMGEIAAGIGRLRELKNKSTSSGLRAVIDQINGAAQKITEFRTHAKTLREKKVKGSDEMKALLRLTELQKDAKALGDAATAAVLMERALEKKDQFMAYTQDKTGTNVDAAIATVTDAGMKSTLTLAWGDHKGIANNLNRVLTIIERKRKKVKEITDLPSVWNSFKKLKGVPNPRADLPRRLIVVTALHKLTQDQNLVPIIGDLQNISQLDLDFSRFDSALFNSNETLRHVRDVFRKLAKENEQKPHKKRKGPMDFYLVGGRKYEGFFTILTFALPTFFAIVFMISLCCSIKTHKELTRSERDEDDDEKPKSKSKGKKGSKKQKPKSDYDDDEEEKPKGKGKKNSKNRKAKSDQDEDEEEKPKGKGKKNSKNRKRSENEDEEEEKPKAKKKSKNQKNKKSSAGKKGGKKKRSSEDGDRSDSRAPGGIDSDYMSFRLESEITSTTDSIFLVHRRQ